MEQQLRVWLRHSLVFGLYISPTKKMQFISRPNQILQLQHLKKIYVHLLLFVLCAIYVRALASRKPIPGVASEAVTTIIFSSRALTSLVIIAEGLWGQQQHETFLRLLQEIEFSLKLRLREDIKLDSLPSRVRWHLKYLLWISFICFVMALHNFRQLQHLGYYWYSIGYSIIIRLRIIQLCVYVCVLRNYLECLCMKLQHFVAYDTAPSPRPQTLEYLQAIKHVYDLLYKTFELLNKFAGWSLFAIITCYILDYCCVLYWALLSWEGYLENCSYYVATFWWILPMTAVMWHICYLCHDCKQLDRLLATNLCRIIIMNSSQLKCSYRIFLQQFCTQLELQGIVVAAKSFFVLDFRLLMSVIISVSSFMVMLIQFLYI